MLGLSLRIRALLSASYCRSSRIVRRPAPFNYAARDSTGIIGDDRENRRKGSKRAPMCAGIIIRALQVGTELTRRRKVLARAL